MALFARRIGTPLGEMVLVVDENEALVALEFCASPRALECAESVALPGEDVAWDEGRGGAVVAQLEEYFRGERRTFDLPLAPRGSAFQLRVWDELRRIPFGKTISYGELAERVGKRSFAAARAVGQANATNPIAIIVPCHRVIGADGTLTGYAAGLSFKAKLLVLEGALDPDAMRHPHPPLVRESSRTPGSPRRGAARAAAAGQADLFHEP